MAPILVLPAPRPGEQDMASTASFPDGFSVTRHQCCDVHASVTNVKINIMNDECQSLEGAGGINRDRAVLRNMA